MANPVKSNTLVADKSGDGMLSDRQAAIPLCAALRGCT
jgi:hypothetical protein